MLCRITMHAENDIILPFSYNHMIQGLLYRFINEKNFSHFLHDVGYGQSRVYKLFCFSSIFERPLRIDKIKKLFIFPPDITLFVSSVENDFFQYVFHSLLQCDLYLGKNPVKVQEIRMIPQIPTKKMVVKTYSPITIYSTLIDTEGRRKTYFFHPKEKGFSDKIAKNVIHKYEAYYGHVPEHSDFSISPFGKMRENILSYKGFIIKGYTGKFMLRGNPELIDLALCSGVGGKNAQGFGLVIDDKTEVM